MAAAAGWASLADPPAVRQRRPAHSRTAPVLAGLPGGRQRGGAPISFPAVEFARGLPPQVGIVVNPEGTVTVPLP
ncbi:hypothetical protein ACLMMR_40030, partial [Streptomyces sp. NPDC000405]